MASITAKINSTYNGKGFKDANQGLMGLSKNVTNFQKKVKALGAGLGVTFALQQISKFSKECTSAFNTQQKALVTLNKAVQNNAKLTQNSYKNIIAYTQKLQSSSIYGDEVLQGQASYLAGLGLTEEKIKDILSAATNLSSAGVGTLESNVQNLAKTLNGTAGRLGKTIPELSALTKEELEAGKGIEVLNDKYKGFNETLASGTLEGLQTQVKNITGDIKENVGTIFANLQYNALEKVKPILETINNWLGDNIDRITGVILNLPAVMKIIGNGIGQIMQRFFSPKVFIENIKTVMKAFIEYLKIAINFLGTSVKAIFSFKWGDLPGIWTEAMKKTGELVMETGTAIASGVSDITDQIAKDVDKAIKTGTKPKISINGTTATATTTTSTDGTTTTTTTSSSNSDEYSNIEEQLLDAFGETGKYINQLLKGDYVEALLSAIGQFVTALAEQAPSLKVLMNVVSKTFDLAANILAPVIEPLLNSVLKILDPLVVYMQIIGNHLKMYANVLKPVIDLVSYLFEKITVGVVYAYNAVIDVVNWIVRAVNNALGWLGIHLSAFDRVDMGSITGGYSTITDSSSGSSGNSASYTAARDIYVTINYNNSYVNGDAQEIALSLRDEIERAEKLGY